MPNYSGFVNEKNPVVSVLSGVGIKAVSNPTSHLQNLCAIGARHRLGSINPQSKAGTPAIKVTQKNACAPIVPRGAMGCTVVARKIAEDPWIPLDAASLPGGRTSHCSQIDGQS